MLALRKLIVVLLIVAVLAVSVNVMAQDEDFVFGDMLPTAPELAARGDYAVGVRTLTLVNPDEVNYLALESDPDATYDRPFTVEIWYPAVLEDGQTERVSYEETLGRADQEGTLEPFTFNGRAARDAAPDNQDAPYPLVVVSHGYPGSRYMMTYLTENLASKGVVVVAVGHTDSTFLDAASFFSTLYNRTLDQRFVIDAMAETNDGDGFLNGMVDTDNTTLIGYSMGGYGALNTIGAGYNDLLGEFVGEVASPILANSEDYLGADERVKAAVLFAPWGGDLFAFNQPGVAFWDADALANITVPTLWITGSEDDIAGYDGIVGLFDNAVNSERYLLTFDNALHNVAPNPPPPVADDLGEYERYADPTWDEQRINNVNQHFVTAFIGQYVLGEDYSDYLDVPVEVANDGEYVLDDDGNPSEDFTYSEGFLPRTALGLSLRFETP